jgi:DMSO/TMAO reductase YedYZ molybdopterin-dependent catalytic subunit
MATVTIPRQKGTTRYNILRGIGAGTGGALAMLLLMGALRWLFGFPTLPEMMLDTFLKLLGGRAFSNLLDEYYYAGLPLYFTLVLLGVLFVGALLGLLYAWLSHPRTQTTGNNARLYLGLLFGAAVALLLNVVFLPLVSQDPFASGFKGIVAQTSLPPWLGLSLMAFLFGVVTHFLLPKTDSALTDSPEADTGRRQLLRIAGGTLVALLGGAAFWYGGTVLRQGGFTSPVTRKPETLGAAGGQPDAEPGPIVEDPTPTPRSRPRPTNTPRPQPSATPEPPPSTPEPLPPTPEPPPPPTDTPVPPTPEPTATPEPPPPTSTPSNGAHPEVPIPINEITPTASFYHVSKNVFDPTVSVGGWKLAIKGLVDNPYELAYGELTALPAETVTIGMMCISNPIGGGLIGSTTWRGVRLADLLKRAQPKEGVVDLLMTAADGYTDSITYHKAQDPDVVLVWEMGGKRLTPEHGYPARLLVPGIYGMKHVKWIQSIELVARDYKGYWQEPSQGWSDPAPVNTTSRIDFPAGGTVERKTHTISGIAFAGDRSISKVEVSLDGGKTWRPAYLKPPLSGTSWAVWAYSWTPNKAGKYTVAVRAYDGSGKVQPSRVTDPYPNGATGHHKVTFTVK